MKNNDGIIQSLHDRGICVLIPTYNNVGTIGRVVSDVLQYCSDVIVVDDGSNDGTTDVLKAVSGIHLVSYTHNRGKGYALKQGFREALRLGFVYAITIDADGQHYAHDIPAFLKANKSYPGSLILGARREDNIVRSKGSTFANKFSNFWFTVQTMRRLPDTQTGFRLYPLKKLHGYQFITSRYEAELELLVFAAWHGVGIHSIPVDVYYPPKEERVSHFRPAKDFTRISILNTCLCFLAVIYGLPMFIARKSIALLRTLWALLLLSLTVLVFYPAMWIYTHVGKMTEAKKWRLHLIIHRAIRFLTLKAGIACAHFSSHIDPDTDFDTPSVIICNHQSHLDLLYLLSLTPKLIFLTNDWVWRSPLFGFLIHGAEYYPASDGIDTLMPHFRSLVERGYSIAIFPEGTRSADCRIARFHQGAFFVAKELGVGIVPIMLYGTGKVLPKKTYHIRKSPIYMEVGKSVSHEELATTGTPREQAKAFHKMYVKRFEEISNKMEQM